MGPRLAEETRKQKSRCAILRVQTWERICLRTEGLFSRFMELVRKMDVGEKKPLKVAEV